MRLGPRTVAAVLVLVSLVATGRALPKDTASAPSSDPARRLAIVQPGYPGSDSLSKGFRETLTRYLEGKTGLESLSTTYHNVPKDALDDIEKHRPRLGVVSLGFYLAHRQELRLKPRLETVPDERFYVVARRGTASSLEELRFQSVAGGALYEPEFIGWVVFPEAQIESWKVVPTLQPSRALRELQRGEHRGLVLNGREYRSFEAIGKAQDLVKLAESEPYTVALVVAFEPPGGAAGESPPVSPDIDKLVAAFRDMAKDKEGQSILATMGCKEFKELSEVRRERLEALAKRFDARKKSTR